MSEQQTQTHGYGYIDGYPLKSVDMDMDIEAKFHIHGKPDATCLSVVSVGHKSVFYTKTVEDRIVLTDV